MNDTQNLELEQALKQAEDSHGPDSVQVAECLERYAKFLRDNKLRILDAANMEARARVIRSKQPATEKPAATAVSNDQQDHATKKCPYCAETIRAEAVICRFCNRDLQRKPGHKHVLIAASVLSLLGLLAIIAFISHQQRANTVDLNSSVIQKSATQADAAGSISGAAWVTNVGGSSEILRGLEIALCDSGMNTNEIDSIVSHYERYFVEDWPIKLGISAKLINSVSKAIAPHAIQTTKTDVDGKYKLASVPAGSYYLFAQHSTGTGYLAWIFPVTVSQSQSVSLDLDNSKASKIINTKTDVGPSYAIELLKELQQEQ